MIVNSFNKERLILKRVLFAAGAAYLTAAGAALAAPAVHPSPLAALDAAKTVQVTETMMSADAPAGPVKPGATLRVKVQRPGQARIEQSKPGAKATDAVLVTDGKTLTEYIASRKQYRKGDSPPLADFGYDGLPALYAYPATAKSAATTLNGTPALLYTVAQNANGQTVTHKLWLNSSSRLPLRQSIYTGAGAKAKEVMRIVFSSWSLDKPLEAAVFAFAPPSGVTEYKEPTAPATTPSAVPAPAPDAAPTTTPVMPPTVSPAAPPMVSPSTPAVLPK